MNALQLVWEGEDGETMSLIVKLPLGFPTREPDDILIAPIFPADQVITSSAPNQTMSFDLKNFVTNEKKSQKRSEDRLEEFKKQLRQKFKEMGIEWDL